MYVLHGMVIVLIWREAFLLVKHLNDAQKLVDVAQNALKKGIEKARVGNRLSDISAAIQQEVEKHGFGVVRDFAGHGIGKNMHEDPEIVKLWKTWQRSYFTRRNDFCD